MPRRRSDRRGGQRNQRCLLTYYPIARKLRRKLTIFSSTGNRPCTRIWPGSSRRSTGSSFPRGRPPASFGGPSSATNRRRRGGHLPSRRRPRPSIRSASGGRERTTTGRSSSPSKISTPPSRGQSFPSRKKPPSTRARGNARTLPGPPRRAGGGSARPACPRMLCGPCWRSTWVGFPTRRIGLFLKPAGRVVPPRSPKRWDRSSRNGSQKHIFRRRRSARSKSNTIGSI